MFGGVACPQRTPLAAACLHTQLRTGQSNLILLPPGLRGPLKCIPHGLFSLTDVNECETGEALCDPNADCTDILTSYSCQCRQGFEGNGFNCTGLEIYVQVGYLSCS